MNERLRRAHGRTPLAVAQHRPWLSVALALAAGQNLGLAVGQNQGLAVGQSRGLAVGQSRGLAASASAGVAAGSANGWLAAGALGAACLAVAWLYRGGASRRAALLPAWCCLALLSALQAEVPRPLDLALESRFASHGGQGHFEQRGSRWGRVHLEAEPGRGSSGFVEVSFDGPLPADGCWLSLLPPLRSRRSARGPVEPLGGLAHRRWVAQPDQWVVHDPRAPTVFETLRGRAAQRLHRAGGDLVASLGPALGVGDRSNLGAANSDLFTRVGVRHLLALSGLHVGLIALLLRRPLGRSLEILLRACGLGPRHRELSLAFAGALACLGFVELCGAAAPLRRAGWVLALASLARALPRPPHAWPGNRRRSDAWSLLGAAASFEILRDADAVASPGVQLTYGATAAILCLGGLSGVPAFKPSGGIWRGALLSVFATAGRRIFRGLRASFSLSVVATLGTLPALWQHFGEWAPSGGLTTILAAPALLLLLPMIWWSALDPDSSMGIPIGAWTEHALSLWLDLLKVADRFPDTPLLLPQRPWLVVSGLCGACLYAWIRRKGRWFSIGVLAIAGLHVSPAAPEELELWCLDVGHGSCIAWRGPDGEVWIADAGTSDRRHLWGGALAPLLSGWRRSRVHAHLSHDDFDHRSAWNQLESRLGNLRSLGASEGAQADLERGLSCLHERAELGYRVYQVRGLSVGGNEGARTLLIEYAGRRLWLLSDADGAGLDATLEWLGPEPPDLWTAPHHGSDTAAVAALLDRGPPGRVWISAATSPALADELDRRGWPWSWTGRDGPLGLRIDSAGRLTWLGGAAAPGALR